jgi:sulfotransferase family protein
MRVFNLSHHKCGTTSVHHALAALGFNSHHWFHPEHLLEVHLAGKVPIEPLLREENAAWNDLPIGLMYRELYQAFPDATFLFVRRDRNEWLESIRKHIVGSWAAPLKMHSVVYGYPITAANFEFSTCLRVYDQLCNDIQAFFSGKPNFHLIDFAELSWNPLCKAVEKGVPAIPFPWTNKSAS